MAHCLPRGFPALGLRSWRAPRAILSATRPSQRTLKTSPCLCAARSPAARPPSRSLAPAAAKSAVSSHVPAARETPYALLKTLAQRTSPMVLYEGPSHFWFYTGCWATGFTLLGWTLLTGPSVVLTPLPDQPAWTHVPVCFAYCFLFYFGGMAVLRTKGVIKRIRILPQGAQQPATPAAAAARAAPQNLELEVTVKGMLPFMHSRVLRAPLDQASLKTRLSLPEAYVPRLKRIELEKHEARRSKAILENDIKNNVLTMPFRHLARGFARLNSGFLKALTDRGFGTVYVNGKTLKIDVTNGYAHDRFRTLEKLLPVKET